MMKRRLTILVFLLIIAGLMPDGVYAELTARGLGMGGAYTALARGAHAQAWNPANLGLPDNPDFTMDIFSVGAGLSNNSFTKSMYDRYNGAHWDSGIISDILDHIPQNGLAVDMTVSMRFLSFSKGPLAFTLGTSAGSFLQMDKSVFDLALKGNQLNQSYSLKNARGESMALGYAALSWGHPVDVAFAEHFSVGWTVAVLQGFAGAQIDQSDIRVKTTSTGFDLKGDWQTSHGLGSTGIGIDLGAAAQIRENWAAGVCLANLFSRISWNRDAEVNQGYFNGESLAVLDFSDDDEKDDFQDSSWTEEGQGFSRGLPVILRMGTAYDYDDFIFTADYKQGFKRGLWTAVTPQLSVGTEWRQLSWLPLRAGLAFGGQTGFASSIGFGFRPGRFVFDFGLMNRGFVTSGSSKGLFIAVDVGVNLN